jgi:hypothetical protein
MYFQLVAIGIFPKKTCSVTSADRGTMESFQYSLLSKRKLLILFCARCHICVATMFIAWVNCLVSCSRNSRHHDGLRSFAPTSNNGGAELRSLLCWMGSDVNVLVHVL